MSLGSMIEAGLRNEPAEIARKGSILVEHAQDMGPTGKLVATSIGTFAQRHPDAIRTAEVLGIGATAYGAGAAMFHTKEAGLTKVVSDMGHDLLSSSTEGTIRNSIGRFLIDRPATVGYGATLATGAAGAYALHSLYKQASELPLHPWKYAAYHGGYIAAADLLAESLYTDVFHANRHNRKQYS